MTVFPSKMSVAVADNELWQFVWNGSSVHWSLWLRRSLWNSATYLRRPEGDIL